MSLRYKELRRVARQMSRAGLMRKRDNQNVLWHYDFSAQNIKLRNENSSLEEGFGTSTRQDLPEANNVHNQSPAKDDAGRWVISEVTDWDDALSIPLVIARHPPTWLWFEES